MAPKEVKEELYFGYTRAEWDDWERKQREDITSKLNGKQFRVALRENQQ